MGRLGRAAGTMILSIGMWTCSGCTDEVHVDDKAPPIAGREAARCYDKDGVKAVRPLATLRLDREVLILVDQTTDFPDSVKKSAIEQVSALVLPGTKISLGTFSAFTQNSHTMITFESYIESDFPLARERDAPMKALARLRDCLDARRTSEAERLSAALSEGMEGNRPDMQRSDILSNIKTFGQRMKESAAEARALVLVSDMLENSSTVSFYHKGAVRKIEPVAELESVERAALFADLPMAKVFVIGAGLLPAGTSGSRSWEQMQPLEEFWTRYFERSGASSVEIGTPILMTGLS